MAESDVVALIALITAFRTEMNDKYDKLNDKVDGILNRLNSDICPRLTAVEGSVQDEHISIGKTNSAFRQCQADEQVKIAALTSILDPLAAADKAKMSLGEKFNKFWAELHVAYKAIVIVGPHVIWIGIVILMLTGHPDLANQLKKMNPVEAQATYVQVMVQATATAEATNTVVPTIVATVTK